MALSASRGAIASPLSWPQKQRIMIPEFDENGNLPPGVYFCQWEEFKDRFATNLTRARIIDGLELAISQLKAAGCRTVYINGSFVTDKPLPGDFDACYDLENVDLDGCIPILILPRIRLFLLVVSCQLLVEQLTTNN